MCWNEMSARLKGGLIALLLFIAFFIFKMVQTEGNYRYFVSVSPIPPLLYEAILLVIGMIVMSAVIFCLGAVIGSFIGWIVSEPEAKKEAKE